MLLNICLIFLFCTFFFYGCWGQIKNCKPEYNGYYRCLYLINDQYNNLKALPDGQWVQIENDIKQCFLQYSCSNPWGTEAVRNGRRSCFNTQRNRLRNELQTCVRNMYDKKFDIPQEALENSVYNRYANYIQKLSQNQVVCPPGINKGLLMQCVNNRIKVRTTKSRTTGNRCQQKQMMCDSKISDLCYNTWQRQVRPGLRSCISQMQSSGRLEGYRSNYLTCVQQKDRFHPAPRQDPNYQYFSYLQTTYGNIQESCPKRKGIVG